MSTLVSFIERATELRSGVDGLGLHWKQLLASSWMATDGTAIKVIVPKLPAAHNGYVDLYRNDELAAFQYEPTKDGDVVVAKLRPFRGTLTADAKHRSNDVFASGCLVEAGCNEHGRRKTRERVEVVDPSQESGPVDAGALLELGPPPDLGLLGGLWFCQSRRRGLSRACVGARTPFVRRNDARATAPGGQVASGGRLRHGTLKALSRVAQFAGCSTIGAAGQCRESCVSN